MPSSPPAMRLRRGVLAAAMLSTLAALLPAQTVILTATADARQETPPATSPGTGTGTLVVHTATNTAELTFTFGDLVGAVTIAHIHGPADPGVNTGALLILPTTSPIVATWNYTEGDEAAIVEGRTYVNVHTTAFGAGEIRGQLVPATSYCWGDGNGTPCPCGNDAAVPGRGCENSTGYGGLLLVTGNHLASGGNDRFFGMSLIPNQPALLFMGLNAVDGGDGAPFGDGLRCTGGGVVRLGVELPDATGLVEWTPDLRVPPNAVRRVQGWYRNPGGGPCGSTFNLTNALEIAFQ